MILKYRTNNFKKLTIIKSKSSKALLFDIDLWYKKYNINKNKY